ncbi:unnamed protein product [Caenorhabditis nigoni]
MWHVGVGISDDDQPWSPMRRKRARSSNPNGCKTTATTSTLSGEGIENNNGKVLLPVSLKLKSDEGWTEFNESTDAVNSISQRV